jgi:hypothetical protein
MRRVDVLLAPKPRPHEACERAGLRTMTVNDVEGAGSSQQTVEMPAVRDVVWTDATSHGACVNLDATVEVGKCVEKSRLRAMERINEGYLVP